MRQDTVIEVCVCVHILSHSILIMSLWDSYCYLWEKWGSERFSDFPKATQSKSWAYIQTWVSFIQGLVIFCRSTLTLALVLFPHRAGSCSTFLCVLSSISMAGCGWANRYLFFFSQTEHLGRFHSELWWLYFRACCYLWLCLLPFHQAAYCLWSKQPLLWG